MPKIDLSTPEKRQAYWTKVASNQLLGKKIVAVRYMSKMEQEAIGWDGRCVVLLLDDGNLLWPSMDEEGNGPAVFFTNNQKQPVLPVL